MSDKTNEQLGEDVQRVFEIVERAYPEDNANIHVYRTLDRAKISLVILVDRADARPPLGASHHKTIEEVEQEITTIGRRGIRL